MIFYICFPINFSVRIITCILWFLTCGNLTFLSGQCLFDSPDNPGLLCHEAIFLCGSDLDGFSGTLPVTNPLIEDINPGCPNEGDPDNLLWFSFVANSSNLEIHIQPSSCGGGAAGVGIQTGIYASCDFDQKKIACGQNDGTTEDLIILQADPGDVIPGELYYLYVDGYGGAVCDFSIEVISGVCTDIPSEVDCAQDCGITNNYGDHKACTAIVETYTFDFSTLFQTDAGCGAYHSMDVLPIACVEWEILPNTGTEFTIQGSSSTEINDFLENPSISVEWHTPGEYTIRPVIHVNPLISLCGSLCQCTDDILYTVTVEESEIIQLPLVELCPGDCYEFCGYEYCQDANLTCYDRDNCRIEIQEIIVKDISFVDLGDHYICDGSCFEFNGIDFCIPTIFSVPSTTACDTSYIFELKELVLDVEASGSRDTIDCNHQESLLTGSWSSNAPGGVETHWEDENGTIVTDDDLYTATSPGTYTYVVIPLDNPGCVSMVDITIVDGGNIPQVEIPFVILDCNNPQITVETQTIDDIIAYEWTGPGGYIFSGANPLISSEGIYTVVLTGANGCTNMLSMEVMDDFDSPAIQMDPPVLDCQNPQATLTFQSEDPLEDWMWSYEGQVISGQNPMINQAGTYSLTVTGTNGCTSTMEFEVNDNRFDPAPGLDAEYRLGCGVSKIPVIYTPPASSLTYEWSSQDGAFNLTNEGIDLLTPGTYILKVIDQQEGCTGYDTIVVTGITDMITDVALDFDDPVCPGDSVLVSMVPTGGSSPYLVVIGVDTSVLNDGLIFPQGQNQLTIIDANGCSVDKDVSIPVISGFSLALPESISIKYNQYEEIEVEYSIEESDVFSISWYNESEFLGEGKSMRIFGDQPKTISVILEDVNGCTVEKQINILIDYEIEIYFPDIFSPNGDGQNDLFFIFTNGNIGKIEDLSIYDRYGEMVYRHTNMDFGENGVGWDGNFRGKKVEQGVYVFVLEYKVGQLHNIKKTGTITLIR